MGLRELSAELIAPVVPEVVALVTSASPIVGVVSEVLYTNPRAVIEEPPWAVTFPFSVAPVEETDDAAEVVNSGVRTRDVEVTPRLSSVILGLLPDDPPLPLCE